MTRRGGRAAVVAGRAGSSFSLFDWTRAARIRLVPSPRRASSSSP